VVAFGVTRGADPRAWPGWVRRRVDGSSENDAGSSATRKSLLLTSKSEMLTRKSLLLTSKSEMLARKSLFLTSKSEMLASKSLFLIADVEPRRLCRCAYARLKVKVFGRTECNVMKMLSGSNCSFRYIGS